VQLPLVVQQTVPPLVHMNGLQQVPPPHGAQPPLSPRDAASPGLPSPPAPLGVASLSAEASGAVVASCPPEPASAADAESPSPLTVELPDSRPVEASGPQRHVR
jgi:hypothetical protein